MASYAFKALDLAGAAQRGEVEAEDQKTVAAQLRSKGLIVVDIEEQKKADVGDLLARFKKVKASELAIATRQLSTMISSGMSLLRALYVLEDQAESDKFRDTLTAVRKDVEAGISMSDALAKHPDVFNGLYVAMVGSGETGGVLESALIRVADQLEKDEALRRQVKSALAYPVLIGGFAVVVLIAMVAFLVPVFEKVFEDFGGDLPLITKITVTISDFITGRWYVLIAMVVGSIFGFRKWKKTERGAEQWDRFKLRIPFSIGTVVQKIALARFSRTFSALVSAGVPMLEAIDITGKTSGNRVVEKSMLAVRESVKGGGTISGPMRSEPRAFPIMVTQMIAVGEESGALDAMLSKIADFYDDQVAAALKALTSLLEPLLIVAVGAAVGFIVISMYLPLFQVYDQVK